jgi:hypothetical protein
MKTLAGVSRLSKHQHNSISIARPPLSKTINSIMEQLKHGVLYKNRAAFTTALDAYLMLNYGENKQKFSTTGSNSRRVRYTCKECLSKASPRDDGGSPVDTYVEIDVASTEKLDLSGEGKTTRKGGAVRVIKWEPCSCEMSPISENPTPLPHVGQIFWSRLAYREYMQKHCTSNRKFLFHSRDTRNKIARMCPKIGCPGMVECSLAHQSYDHSYVPPLTVGISVPCICDDMFKSEPTRSCGYCTETFLASEVVPRGTCCKAADDCPFCFGCLKTYVTNRPTHRMNWSENNSMQHKVVQVGVEPNQIWFQCAVCRKPWKRDGILNEYVPFGFYMDHPVADKDVFDQLLQHHSSDIQNLRKRGSFELDDRWELLEKLTFLANGENKSELELYFMRIKVLVEGNQYLYSLVDAMEYLNSRLYSLVDAMEYLNSRSLAVEYLNLELINILTDGRSKLSVKAAEEYLKANSLWI